MKKLKNITATEALRLIRLGFTDEQIIQADKEVSGETEQKDTKNSKQKVKKERQKKEVENRNNEEDLTAKEILKKIEEIKEKHEKGLKKIDNLIISKSKKIDTLLDKKEVEFKTPSTTNNNIDVEDISQGEVDF